MDIKKILFFLSVLLNVVSVFSQDEINTDSPEVKVIAMVSTNTITLRWAVNTPLAWKKANELGFVIERKTIVSGGKILKNPIITRLNENPIKPKEKEQWMALTERDDFAAIAAQALFGESFTAEMKGADNDLIRVINQAQEFEQRFSFALYAADQSFETAKYSGLAFVDYTVKKDERYLYTVSVPNQNDSLPIKYGFTYIGIPDYSPLPKPLEFYAVFKDKNAILTWNSKLLQNFYTSYIVERSDDDGKSFKSITKVPIVNLSAHQEQKKSRTIHVDSLQFNDKTYKYRIKGISPFGISGPYSKVLSGKARKTVAITPYITSSKLDSEKTATIQWTVPKQSESYIKEFKIMVSDKPKGFYKDIITTIPNETRSYILKNLQQIGYFKVVAIDKYGKEASSFPKMIQLEDKMPPAVPQEITGVIDSLGIVKLNWKLNLEPDFLGYRIFRSNFNDQEFTQITFKPTPNNFFIDTINLKNLNEHVYYKIQSFDKRYNPSGFSKVLQLEKPDIIKPSSPVFTSFKVNNKEVFLQWVTSSSKDAVSTLLYRKEKNTGKDWALIKEFPIPENEYIDKNINADNTYLYTILAIDKSGLESNPIQPLKITVSDTSLKPKIEKFRAVADRENNNILLSWKYKEEKVNRYVLYKAKVGFPPTTYKTVSKHVQKTIDTTLQINTKYIYLIQAIFDSGAKSPIEKIEINY